MARVVANRKRRTSFQIKDDYVTGLTSEQIWHCLNNLMMAAVGPVFQYTEYGVDLCLTLVSASMDKRRKVSIYPSDDCRGILMHTLLYRQGQDVLEILQKIGVERNLIMQPIIDAVTVNELPGKMLADSPFSEESLIRHVRQSTKFYMEFREQVAQRFIRLSASLGAKNAWVKNQNGLISESNDHTNNYMLAALRAIDKFYPHRGTLAQYVLSWMNNAAGSAYLVYAGEAYSVPRSHRRSFTDDANDNVGNFSLPLDNAVDVEQESYSTSDVDHINLMRSIYSCSVLHPAILDCEMPIILQPSDLQTISEANNVIHIPADISKHVFNYSHALMATENLNFASTQNKRRGK